MTTVTTPLTTVFTPPPNCASHWTYEPSTSDGNDVPGGLLLQRAQGPPFAPASALDSTCYPDLRSGWGRYPATTLIFSPGVCPFSYTTALTSNGPTTTTGTCCPTGFDYYSTLGTLNGGTANVVFYGCTSIYYSDRTPTSVFAISPYGSTGSLDGTVARVTEITGPITMWAQPITVAHQQRDSAVLPTSTTTTSTTSSRISSDSPPLNTGANTPSTPKPGSTTLSGGAIAGIAIGTIVLLVILTAIIFWVRRNKKRSKRNPIEVQTDSTFTSPSSFGSKFEPYQDDGQPHFSSAPVQRHELASTDPRFERESTAARPIELGSR